MKVRNPVPFPYVLPLPGFVLRPLTAVVIAAVHVYLAAGHLSQLIAGDVQWTHFWKGFGALAGAYVFAALASRGNARAGGRRLRLDPHGEGGSQEFGPSSAEAIAGSNFSPTQADSLT
jgi:hypothetical protein